MAIRGIDLWRSSGQSRRLKSSCRAGSPFRHLMANAGTGTASVAIFAATPEPHSSNESPMSRMKSATKGIDCLDLYLLRSPIEGSAYGSTFMTTPLAADFQSQQKPDTEKETKTKS